MSILESLLHGGISLVDMWYQGKSFIDLPEGEPAASKAYVAKAVEEYFTHRIDGAQLVGKTANALLDYTISEGLYKVLTLGDIMPKPMASFIAKGIATIASDIGGMLVTGIGHLFTGNETTQQAEQKLRASGKLNDDSLLSKLGNFMGLGQDVNDPGAPLGGGGPGRSPSMSNS